MVERGRKLWWKGICILGVALAFTLLLTTPTLAWWNTDWKYRRAITIQSDNALTDYQILVQLNSINFDFSKANPDGSDIRFVDEDDATKLSYWIEEWNASSQTAKIWVKVPSIPAGEKTIYLYYNNSDAVSESDGEAVFEFFDDFEDGVIDTSKWTIISDNWVEENGYLKGTGDGSTYTRKTIRAEGVCLKNFVAVMIWKVSQEDCLANFIYRAQSTSIETADRYWARIESRSSYGQGIHMLKSVGGGESDLGNKVPYSDVTTFKKFIMKIHEDEHYYEVEGEGSATITDSSIMNEGYFGFQTEKYSTFVDVVYIAKYTSPEPSVSVGAEELPPSFNISGYVFYANNTPCNNPTVNVTNLNNGMEWVAETNETSNYYHFVIYEGQANASEQLKFEVSSPDGKQTNTTYYTITDEDISAGNLTLNFTLTGDPEFVWRNLSVTPLNGLAPLTINATAEVENIGGSDGECNATFLINGVVVDWKIVSVAVGEVKNVSFTHTFEWDGSYDVTIDNLSAKTVVVQMHDVKINKSLEGSCDGIRIERNGTVVECYETLLADEVYHIKLQILNNGTFDDGVNVVVNVDDEILYTDTKTLTAKTGVWNVDIEFDTSTWSSGDHIITATVSITGGESDAHPEDNTATRDITISTIVVSVVCEDETHIRVSIQHAHGSGFIYVGAKPQQYTYTFKHQGDGSYVLSTPFLQTNKTYYLKVCDEKGCGEVLEFKITKEESLVEEEFGKEYKELTEGGDVLNISKLSNTIPSIYTTLLTDMFWAMFFGGIFLAYWIRQEDVMLPSIVGMISGVAMIGLLPPSAQHIAYILLVISIAGTLYTIIKARR